MATIANLVARLTADPTGFVAGMATADGALTGFMTKSTLVKGGLLGIGTVALVVGKQAFDMGLAWDEALDTIQTQTGATGDELEALGQSTLNVYTRIPAELQTVAEAISLINSRLDLTGPVLETVTAQLVELSRITGTDLTGNINAVADAMLKWNVPAAEIPGHIDALFRASQATGVPLERLAQLVADNGAALMAFGFTLPETIALMAALEGSGVNTEMAMRGLRTAIGKLADEGVTDAKAGLEGLFTQIKNAPTDFDAAAIAIEYFGTRAGPELAAAIRSGKLSLDEMLDIVANGEGTILGTAEATNDFAEKLQILENRANALLVPLGSPMIAVLTAMVENLTTAIEGVSKLGEAFGLLPDKLQGVITGMAGVAAGIMLIPGVAAAAQMAVDLMRGAWELLASAFSAVSATISAGLTTLTTAFSTMASSVGSTLNTLVQTVKSQFLLAKLTAQTQVEEMKTSIITKITNLWSSVTSQMEAIKSTISTKLSEAKTAAVAAITLMTQSMGAQLAGFASTAAGLAYSIGAAIANGIRNGIEALAGWAIAAANNLAQGILDALSGALSILSPSKKTEYFGEMLGKGLIEGMHDAENAVMRASTRMGEKALQPLEASNGTLSADSGRGGAPVIIITPDPEKWVQYMRDAKAGGDFARNFGHELGLYAGQP